MAVSAYVVVFVHHSGVTATRLGLDGKYSGSDEESRRIEAFLREEGFERPQLLACVPELAIGEKK
jgi:hypothetical protein